MKPATDQDIALIRGDFPPHHAYHFVINSLIARIEADAKVIEAAKVMTTCYEMPIVFAGDWEKRHFAMDKAGECLRAALAEREE